LLETPRTRTARWWWWCSV